MGNLQLDQPGKALAYIRNTVVSFTQEQKIAQIPVPQLAAILIGFLIRLRQEDVLTTIDYPDEMKKEDFWEKHWREEYIEALYGYTINCINELAGYSLDRSLPLNAEVYLYSEPGGLSCQFMLSDEESVLMDKMVKLNIQL